MDLRAKKDEIGITTQEIINKSIELDENQKKNQTALEQWVLSFLRRYSYGIRASTHIGQKLKEGSNEDYKKFLTTLYNLRNNLGDEEDYSNMYNIDETPIYLESISKNTIAPIGAKSNYIRAHGGEKTRITVILTIAADGRTLPTFLIFKDEKNGKKESILNNCENCKKKKYL